MAFIATSWRFDGSRGTGVNNVHVVRFVGRSRISDWCGEKLHEVHVARVLEAAFRELTSLRLRDARVRYVGARSQYVFYSRPLCRKIICATSRAIRRRTTGGEFSLSLCSPSSDNWRHRRVRCRHAEESYVSACIARGQRAGDVKHVALDPQMAMDRQISKAALWRRGSPREHAMKVLVITGGLVSGMENSIYQFPAKALSAMASFRARLAGPEDQAGVRRIPDPQAEGISRSSVGPRSHGSPASHLAPSAGHGLLIGDLRRPVRPDSPCGPASHRNRLRFRFDDLPPRPE